MFCKSLFALAVGLCVFAATGCQPLPHPFQPEQSRKSANPLLELPDRAGIFVRPVDGLPAETSERLARALADALVRRNIPAFTETANRQSLILTGSLIGGQAARSRSQAALEWRLTGGQNETANNRTFTQEIGDGALDPDDQPGLAALADRAAIRIAGLVQNPDIKDRTLNLRKRSLHVSPIDGAPPEAGAVLRTEIENALRRKALRVSSRLLDDAVIIAGSVALTNGKPGKKRITLDWAVLRSDGFELGKLTQNNEIETKRLDSDWPQIARNIAIAAADGIRRLLDKIPDEATDIQQTGR